MRAIEWARVWSKFFNIEYDRDRRLKKSVFATFAAKSRSKIALQKSKKFVFLNNAVNSQVIFNLFSKKSLYKHQFEFYLIWFKSFNRCRRDTAHSCLFTCLRQLLKFVELSFANICTNAIFERIKLYQRLRREKNSK